MMKPLFPSAGRGRTFVENGDGKLVFTSDDGSVKEIIAEIVNIPKANYITVRGKGNPNEAGGA